MIPIVAIVGRPNVGKSTLFNRLTRSRDALVADLSGLTRDRKFGRSQIGDRPFIVVDTGGLEAGETGIELEMSRQARMAIAESDVVLFMVDARSGVLAQDQAIAEFLRRAERPTYVLANKAEGVDRAIASADFFSLGLGNPYAISASHGEGVKEVVEYISREWPTLELGEDQVEAIRVAVVGRPNVGKSTLINAWVGEDRVISYDLPGTTRDAIEIPFKRGTDEFVLVDTAGLRKKGRVFQTIEKVSVVKTLQAVEQADVVVLVIDAKEGLSDQDAHILGFVLDAGRAVVVAINKADSIDRRERDVIDASISRKLAFADFARKSFISATTRQGVDRVLRDVKAAYSAANAKLSTPRLTRALATAIERQAPPRNGLVRPKLRYAHQGGSAPPTIIVHGNSLENIPESYTRFLEKHFREAFKLEGTPLRVQYRTGKNPFHAKAAR